jgi:hypothetical protein
MFVIVKLLYGTWERREKKRMMVKNNKIHNICAGRGYNHMY